MSVAACCCPAACPTAKIMLAKEEAPLCTFCVVVIRVVEHIR